MHPFEKISVLEPSPLMAALSSLVALMVAAVVLNRDPSRSDNRAFFTMIVLSILANLNASALFFSDSPSSLSTTQFRLVFALGGLTVYAMVIFAHAFPLNRRAGRKLFYGLGVLASVQCVASLAFPGHVATLWYSRTYFPLCTGLAIYFIYQNYRLLEASSARLGLVLVQCIILIRYAMLAASFGAFRAGGAPDGAMAVFNFVIAPPGMAVLLGYGLMRFQLLGFRFFLSRSLAYFIVSTGALMLYLGLLRGLHVSLRMFLQIESSPLYYTPALTVLILLAFHPLRVKAEALLDQWLDKGYVRAQAAVEDYFAETQSVLDLVELQRKGREAVRKILPNSRLALATRRPVPRVTSFDKVERFLPEGWRGELLRGAEVDPTETRKQGASSPRALDATPAGGVEVLEVAEWPELNTVFSHFEQTGSPHLQRTARQGFPGKVPDILSDMRADLVIPYHREASVEGALLIQAPDADGPRVQLLVELARHMGLQLENSQFFQEALEANAALKQANRDLDNTRLFLESLFESVPAGVLVLDRAGQIVRWNRGMERLTGIRRETALSGEELSALLPTLELSGNRQDSIKDLTASPLPRELRVPGRDEAAIVHVRLSMFRDRSAQLGGTVIIFNDVTEQVKLQEQLEANKRLAALGQFAAAIAHEIRTPMTSIQMNVQILAGKLEVPAEDYEYFELILTELNRLNRTVSEILDFARPMRLATAELEVADLIDEVLRRLYFLMAERRVEIEQEVSSGLLVQADGERLEQVLINLLDNASNALTESVVERDPNKVDRVYVRAKSCVDKQGLPGIVIEVQDHGRGMSGETLEHIFDPFYTTRPKGTGLGLAITKKIVEAHKGRISASSVEGEGSTFRIWLPT